ncbi:MAG: sulfite exporter TauE/SafE family protein [Chloroflexi bacterium]|nr:sulfite exporter TauE/SafE family protein [Chloroflexota bacterium]MBU1660872.1 sulfite exporter TauE/SafE family protein [Chloroflexota bacterium]
MISPSLTITILFILFISTFIRSALGFGDALIAMPLLAMLVSMKVATPLVALAASTIALTILLGGWRDVDFKAAWRLIISSLVGIPIGLFFLKNAPEPVIKAALGAVLIAFGLYNLIAPRLPTFQSEKLAYIFGLIAGVLGGAYNTNGPPVVIYGTLRGWSPKSFRTTLQCYFLPTGGMILISHGLAGLWTPTVLQLYAYALPVIMLAIFLGGRASKSVSGGQFNRIIYACLLLMGVLLFVYR